jgi:hypothetical protein
MKLKCLVNLTVEIIKWHKSIMWDCEWVIISFEGVVFLLKKKRFKLKKR